MEFFEDDSDLFEQPLSPELEAKLAAEARKYDEETCRLGSAWRSIQQDAYDRWRRHQEELEGGGAYESAAHKGDHNGLYEWKPDFDAAADEHAKTREVRRSSGRSDERSPNLLGLSRFRIIRGGARGDTTTPEPTVIAAQERTAPGWPLDIEVATERKSHSLVTLRFNWVAFDLVVECLEASRDLMVVVKLGEHNREIRLVRGEKARLGPLAELRLTSDSTSEDIVHGLLSAQLVVRTE